MYEKNWKKKEILSKYKYLQFNAKFCDFMRNYVIWKVALKQWNFATQNLKILILKEFKI